MTKALPHRASGWFAVLMLLLVSQHITLIGDLIGVVLLALPASMAYMLGKGAARFDRQLVCIYLVFGAIVVASFLVNRDNEFISYASFLYVLFLSAPFTLRLTIPPAGLARSAYAFWDAYRALMVLTAVLGLMQIALAEDFFSFRDLVPEAWRVEGYNTTNAVTYGSSIYRANGFMFYEPSFFSQFLALAILVEMRRHRSLPVLALFLTAIIASFSGTGIVLLALGLLMQAVAAGSLSLRRVMAALLPLLVIAVVGIYVFPDFFLARLDEFAQENSSAYIRFIAPVLYIYEAYSASLQGLLLGVGPGVASSVRLADLMADFPGIGKVMYEYGLLGAAALVLLYIKFCSRAAMTAWIQWPFLLVQFVLNNGVFTPVTLAFFLMLAATGHLPARDANSSRGPGRTPVKAAAGSSADLRTSPRSQAT